jgi:hypothetical protein
MCLILLQNAVSHVDDLRKIQSCSDILTVQTGTALTYDHYYTLLEVAAITYDKSLAKAKGGSRYANEHSTFLASGDGGHYLSEEDSPVVLQSYGEGENYGGIDLTVNNFMSVNKTTQFPNRKPNAAPSGGPSKPKVMHNPYLPGDLFTRVRDNWSCFDERTKQLLLSPNKGSPPARPSHNIHNHDFQYEVDEVTDLDPSEIQQEPVPDTSPIMGAITGQSPMDDADIRNVLSAHKARQAKHKKRTTNCQATTINEHEITIDEKVYREVSMLDRIVYRVSESYTLDKRGSLIDRGANGGMAGNDVRVIEKTGRHVDVKGIDIHTVNDLEIVTVAGLVDTNKGPRIVIMHQYAYLGHGKTIHSAGQME